MRVVHRDPSLGDDVVAQWAVREQGPERHHEMREAVVQLARLRRPVGGVHRPPIGRLHVIARRPVGQLEAFGMIGVDVPDLDLAGVQKAEMRGVDVAFERLQPIAFALRAIDVGLVGRQHRRFERRQRRGYRALAHIDVNHPARSVT